MRIRSRRRIRMRPVVLNRTHPVVQFFMFSVHFLALAILTIVFAPAALVYAFLLIRGIMRRMYRFYASRRLT